MYVHVTGCYVFVIEIWAVSSPSPPPLLPFSPSPSPPPPHSATPVDDEKSLHFFWCPHHTSLMLQLSCVVQTITIFCPTAFVMIKSTNKAPGKDQGKPMLSPLSLLPVSLTDLPMPKTLDSELQKKVHACVRVFTSGIETCSDCTCTCILLWVHIDVHVHVHVKWYIYCYYYVLWMESQWKSEHFCWVSWICH